MEITKIGHSCLLIKTDGASLLFDPGKYSTSQNEIKGIDAVVITHKHHDHLDVESLKKIISNNPNSIIITNGEVGEILEKEGVKYHIVENGGNIDIKGVLIEGFGSEHKQVYPTIPILHNVAYLISNTFYYAGDSFYIPQRKIDILALPVAGSWMKLAEAIDFAKEIHPRICFPIHNGMLKPEGLGSFDPKDIFTKTDIEFYPLHAGEHKIF